MMFFRMAQMLIENSWNHSRMSFSVHVGSAYTTTVLLPLVAELGTEPRVIDWGELAIMLAIEVFNGVDN
jgi:hypothetical protein